MAIDLSGFLSFLLKKLLGYTLIGAGIVYGLFALASCDKAERAEMKARDTATIQQKLPAGCTFSDLGEYQSKAVIMVVCDNKHVSTTTERWQFGKSSRQAVMILVQP